MEVVVYQGSDGGSQDATAGLDAYHVRPSR